MARRPVLPIKGTTSLNRGFCLLPQEVLARTGSLLFTGMNGVVVPAGPPTPGRKVTGSSRSLWSFLKGNPWVFVVLIPDETKSIDQLRQTQIRPSLGTRIIGAVDAGDDVEEACIGWMQRFASNNRYVILRSADAAAPPEPDSGHLVYVRHRSGVDETDLSRVRDLLGLSNGISEGLNAIERLKLAAMLELGGQEQFAQSLLRKLFEDLQICPKPPPYADEGWFSEFETLMAEPKDKQFYRLAKAFGVRFRVTAEPADT